MRFAVVELSLGRVIKTGRNWERMRDEVENSSPSRWNNPVLVVIPDNYKPSHEESELPEGYEESNVVAVPISAWGYGAPYAECVNRNRRRFGLPGTFVPSEEMELGIKERQSFFGIPQVGIREEEIPEGPSLEKSLGSAEISLVVKRMRDKEYRRLYDKFEKRVLEEGKVDPKDPFFRTKVQNEVYRLMEEYRGA